MNDENAGALDKLGSEQSRSPKQGDFGVLRGESNHRGGKHIKVGIVPVLVASARLLWRMQAASHGGVDVFDLIFLCEWCAERGELAPAVGGPRCAV